MADDDFKIMQPPGGAIVPPSKSPAAAAAPISEKLPYEEWARRGGIEHWRADVARHCRAWPLGQEVSEDEFNQALHDAFNSRIG